MGVKDVITGLTRAGNRDFGKGLIEAAQKQNRDNLQGQVVGHVQTVLVQVSKQRDYVAQCELNIALLEGRIKAIEDGEFTVSTYGVITYNDDGLNKGVVAMAECTNCGYSARNRDIDSAPYRRER